MNFAEFKTKRLYEICNEPRCLPFGEAPRETHFARGLLELVDAVRPRSMIEIGSHQGISTEVFLLNVARVVAVDPWEGDDKTYSEFMDRCGSYPNLEVNRDKSPNALKHYGCEFDFCYIDAAHDYESVSRDILAVAKLILPDGYIGGHDYGTPSVMAAVLDCLGPPTVFRDESWFIAKPNEMD